MTWWPRRARSAAAVLPAGPPPITTTSQLSVFIACKPKSTRCAALGRRGVALRGVDSADRVHGVRLRRGLVVPVTLDAGQTQREAARITAARLQVAEGHFHDQLRPEVDGPLIAVRLALLELPGLPLQHGIGESLERLSEHHVTARGGVEGAQMQIGEFASTATMSPLGGQHHQIEGVRALDLEPADAAVAGFIGRGERLR